VFLSLRGFLDYAGPNNPLAKKRGCCIAFLLSEWSRHPVPSAFRSSIAGPTNASVYASNDTSRRRPQGSRSGWIRYFLSRRALSSPTTCRLIPALSEFTTTGESFVTKAASIGLTRKYQLHFQNSLRWVLQA
jgi:hypothetical protein